MMKSIFCVLIIAAASMLPGAATTEARSLGHFNRKGNILIVDQLNNRVIEVDVKSHAIVWQFGDNGPVAGPTTIFAPHDAERVGALTYIACTGVPPGGEPGCPSGCPDSRVIAVNKRGRIVWQYGQAGVTGSGTNELNNPTSIRVLPKKRVLITDQGNQRVIEISRKKKNEITWQYGTTGVSGSASNQLNNPACAERRHNGDVVIADQGNNRVIEVDRRDVVGLQIDALSDATTLDSPAYAGHVQNPPRTIIADSLNNRIVEIDNDGQKTFEYFTNARSGSVTNPTPTRAVRLRKSGNILISDQFNHEVIEIDPTGTIVFTFGTIGVAGNGANELNAPCDAKVIKDFTSLTSPKGTGGGGGSGYSVGPGF
jgi:virulence-associated protein VagC